MIRKLAVVAALAAPLSLAVAALASAAPSANGACVQAGLSTLKSAGLLQQAAQKEVNYHTLLPALEDPTYLSLGAVVKLHTTNPELFPWCGG